MSTLPPDSRNIKPENSRGSVASRHSGDVSAHTQCVKEDTRIDPHNLRWINKLSYGSRPAIH